MLRVLSVDFAHSHFDTIGLFSRSIQDLHYLASKTLDLNDSDVFPKKILYPTDFFPHGNSNQQAMVEEFISILEKFLGVKRIDFSLIDRWAKCPPVAAQGKPLREYLAKVLSPLYSAQSLLTGVERFLANVL